VSSELQGARSCRNGEDDMMGNLIDMMCKKQSTGDTNSQMVELHQPQTPIHRRKVWPVSSTEEEMSSIAPSAKNLCFSFHWQGVAPQEQNKKIVHHSLRERYGEIGNKIMYKDCFYLSSDGYTYETFNDLPDYTRLRAEKGCIRVDLWRICFQFFSQRIVGLQSHYISSFEDGTTRKTVGTDHLTFYHRTNNVPLHWIEIDVDSVELDRDEFITTIQPHRTQHEGGNEHTGELVGMSFLTNRRIVHIGSCEDNCDGYDDDRIRNLSLNKAPNSLPHIVALTGVTLNGQGSDGNIHEIGYYTENNAWTILGPLVMMRWLYEERRAEISKDGSKKRYQLTLHDLIELPDELFRNVLSFLIIAKS